MADEILTTGHAATSDPTPAGTTPQGVAGRNVREPEAVIIEETITRPAPARLPPQPIPPPQPPVPVPQKLEEQKIPVAIEPKPPVVPPPIPPPLKAEPPAPLIGDFIPPDLKGIATLESAVPPLPPNPVVRKIPLAIPPLEPPPPPEAASPPFPATPKPETGAEHSNIEHILEDIKLPERRDSPHATNAVDATPARTYDTSLGGLVAGEKGDALHEEGATASAPAPEEPSLSKTIADKAAAFVAPLHTLKSDLQEIVRVKKVSLISAVALEQDKRRGSERAEARVAPRRSGRVFGVLFASGLLVILGLAALFGVYTIMRERIGTTPAATQSSSILFAETTASLPLTDLSPIELKRLLAQVRIGAETTLGSITNIVPVVSVRDESGVEVQSPAVLGEFLAALGTHAPPDLIRALGNEFFLGLHTVDENAPILVIPVVSYERAFAGMLAWESTMNADLSPFFTPLPDQATGPGGLPQKRQFEDLVMRNYDVRALKDDAGGIELYYSFPTKNILIIGESPYSFTEILSRLRAERTL